MVKPETVVRWHRAAFRFYWRRRSRPGGGRPKAAQEIRRALPRKSSLLWSIRGFYRHLETKTLQSANERSFELFEVPAIEVI